MSKRVGERVSKASSKLGVRLWQAFFQKLGHGKLPRGGEEDDFLKLSMKASWRGRAPKNEQRE